MERESSSTKFTDARGEKDAANAHSGLASEVLQVLQVRQLADVVESPARSKRDKKWPMDGREEADRAVRAMTRFDERPPDASKDRIDEHIDGTGAKMQGATSALRHGRRLCSRPVVVDKVVIVMWA